MPYLLTSVIISTYNYASYIVEAIESVVLQNYPTEQIEIIVIDDGSTDDTKDVLKQYVNSRQIKYYYQNNSGKASATRKGIELANGRYIFNLDADDLFLPNKIKETVAIFEGDETIVHVSSPAKIWLVDEDDFKIENIPPKFLNNSTKGEEVLVYFYTNHLLYGGGSTFAARADILKSLIIPDEVNMYIDEYLIITTLNMGYSYFFKEPLSIWRVHKNNYSVNKEAAHLKVKQQVLLKNSNAILSNIQRGNYSVFLKKAYLLQHKTREIYFKEVWGTKSILDIILFANAILKHGFSLTHLKNYSFFTRLIPIKLQLILKAIK